jgi:hypothetical protein
MLKHTEKFTLPSLNTYGGYMYQFFFEATPKIWPLKGLVLVSSRLTGTASCMVWTQHARIYLHPITDW